MGMRFPLLKTLTRALSFQRWFQRPLYDEPSWGISFSRGTELPGGTPLSLCNESLPTDLFQISSVEVTKQPIYIDDVFLFHIYGTFIDTFDDENATIAVGLDCGSYCEEYGNPPGELPHEDWITDFRNASYIEQPVGGRRKNPVYPPEKGYALITSMGYVFPMIVHNPAFYNFTFDAKTADGQRIYCLTAEVCMKWDDPKKNERYHAPWANCTYPR